MIDDNNTISWNDLRKDANTACIATPMEVLSLIKDERRSTGLAAMPDRNGIFRPDFRDSKVVSYLGKWRKSSEIFVDFCKDAMLLYYFLSYLKSLGDTTYPLDAIPVNRHLWRMRNFLSDIKGLVLDIGCNSVENSRLLFSKKVRYVGCDPFLVDSTGVLTFAEDLPFKENSFDCAVFNTSLDHILDYHLAVDEAARVVKPNGYIVFSGYCWLANATLMSDHVHFHHFRKSQLVACFGEIGVVTSIKEYKCPKDDTHRYAIYIKVRVIKK